MKNPELIIAITFPADLGSAWVDTSLKMAPVDGTTDFFYSSDRPDGSHVAFWRFNTAADMQAYLGKLDGSIKVEHDIPESVLKESIPEVLLL